MRGPRPGCSRFGPQLTAASAAKYSSVVAVRRMMANQLPSRILKAKSEHGHKVVVRTSHERLVRQVAVTFPYKT
jgi:hypothetical protein